MLKRTVLSRSLVLAFGSAAVLWGPAQAQQTQNLQRVEITGSAIKRTDVEGPAPVQVITRTEIAKTGATSVNELVRSIPSIDVFDQGELASNSPSGSGTSTLRMRGLAETNLLILLNGRRLPVNALYDASGAGAAFDVNMIPIAAIERIEILKDGGSAIYGADAVAGVFNIITKTDYQGVEASAGYGQSSRSDAKEKRVNLTGGFGDLTKDRFNILGSIDVFKRDPIYRKDRDLTKSVDFRSQGGGDGRSSFSPYGNVLDPATGGFVGLTYKACPPEDLGSGNRCRYDFNKSILTSYNGADRISGILLGSLQVTPDIRLFGEVTYARTKDHFEAHPVPDYFIVPINDPAQLPYEISPGSNTVYIAGRFMQGGPRITDRKAELLNTVVGAEGTNYGLDWKVNVGRGESKVTNSDRNYYDANLWAAATGSGQLDPTVTTNDPAFVESLKVTPQRVGKSTVEYINLQLGGDAMKLPAGTLRYAVGASWWRDKLVDTPDPLTQAGEVVGSIQQAAVDAKRTAKAVFGELQVPILPNLEGQLAARYDKYPTYSQTSPKVALKYTPIPQLAVRGSYTGSFRAPVLKQLYGAQEQGATTITDPAECTLLGVALDANGECLVAAYQVNGSNPDLKPEKGKTLNFGVIFEASSMFSGSVDWWRIRKTNAISSPTITSALQQGFFTRQGAQFLIFTNLQNFAEVETSGIDLDARLRFPGTPVGNITVRDTATYYIAQKTRSASTDPFSDFNGTYALPRYRNTFSVSSDFGPWTATVVARSIGGFYDIDDAYPVPDGTRKVPSNHEFDIQGQYTGFKNLSITAGVRNLFDRMPPFSNQNASSNTYTQMGFAELYNVRGRFYYLNASYKFF